MSKTIRLLLLGAVTCLTIIIGWIAGDVDEVDATPPNQLDNGGKKIESAGANNSRMISGTESTMVLPATKQSGSNNEVFRFTPQRLIADYLLTGNVKSLTEARRLFPEHPLVLLQCALAAQDPESPDLVSLEAADPNNALASLIRAGLYAERGDLSRFKDELQTGLSKSKLSTSARQRMADMLDLIIADGMRGLNPEAYTHFDSAIFDRLGGAYTAFFRNPKLFGDEFASAEIGVGLAHKLRMMDKSSVSYDMAAGQLEIDLLRRLNPNDGYGTEGQTIGQRLAELRQRLQSQNYTAEKYIQPLMSPTGDPVLRLQFFARVRSDGEKAALNWLIKKMDAK